MLRIFAGSLVVTVVALGVALLYGGTEGMTVAAILAVLEVSLSFDNAVVNATILRGMSAFWQRIFLTVGVLIAVFGMRIVFPLIVVGLTAKLSPAEAIRLALEKGDPKVPGTYGFELHEAHPAIAAFGGVFLLLLFLDFIFEEREITWLTWLERPLARIGKLDQLSVVIALTVLLIAGTRLAPEGKGLTVFIAGCLGIVTYVLVNGLGELFDVAEEDVDAEVAAGAGSAVGALVLKTGKAAFFAFLYLEVLDASFSFDGVVGAFAVTSDPIVIALGLGIGAMFVRSLTVYLVRQGTLDDYIFLEHGALWAIGALAGLLFLTMKWEIPDVVTGLTGVVLIGAAFASSVAHNKRHPDENSSPDALVPAEA